MSRVTPYRVPIDVLAEQGLKVAALFAADRPQHFENLSRAGLTAERFSVVRERAQELLNLAVLQQERIEATRYRSALAEDAVKAVVRWRGDEVLVRARVVFGDGSRWVHFRSNELRSRRLSTVAREGRLLVRAIRRFTGLPEADECGLDEALARQGEELLQQLIDADNEEAEARALQIETSADVAERELELSNLLADLERRAVIAFPEAHPARQRYRMNHIRDYVARHRATSRVDAPDPTAAPEVADVEG